MSSLHDPFDLIKTDKDMDNIVPFLAPNKINQMVDIALARPQLSPRKPWAAMLSHKSVWSGGLATAACIALLLTFFSPAQIAAPQNTSQTAYEDISEFSELVMLDTLDRY